MEEVLEALEARAAHRGVSLDVPTDDHSDPPMGLRIGASDAGYADIEAHAEVEMLLAGLSDAERALIVGRFFQGRSQQELADELGISQSYLSRVLRRVLARMRDSVEGDGQRPPTERPEPPSA